MLSDAYPPEHIPAPQKRHILLVDDSEDYRDATARKLEQLGYSVRTANDYHSALPLAEGGDPLDLLITDIVMPGRIHGLSLVNRVRMRRRRLKVIYITSYDLLALTLPDGLVVRKGDGVERLIEAVQEIFSPDGE